MKKYQIACIIVVMTLFSGCVSTKMYSSQKAELIGYKLAFEQLKAQRDSLKMEVESLVFDIDSLQVIIENR